MTYASQQNMIERFGEDELVQVTDKAGTGQIDAAVLAAALSDADQEIDSYIGTRYNVPLASPAPGLVIRLACDIARYFLYDDVTSDKVDAAYDRSIKYLREVSAGRALIPGVQQTAPTSTASGIGTRAAANRVFTMDSLAEL